MARAQGRKTSYPGVTRIEHGEYLLRGTWLCQKTGKRRELERTTKAESPAAAAAIRKKLLEDAKSGAADRPRLRVRDYATSWLASKLPSLKASTRSGYADSLDLHILPALGDHYVDAVDREDVIRWLAKIPGSPASANSHLSVLRSMLRDASVELRIADPTLRVRQRRVKRAESQHKTISTEQFREFLGAVKSEAPQWYALVLTLAVTGMRFGEATALQWTDIDERIGVIRIQRAQWHKHVDTTKTDEVRTVPLPAELADALRARRRDVEASSIPADRKRWVFTAEKTGELHFPSVLRKPMAAAAKSIGMERTPSPHWLRHTMNNLLRQTTTGEVQRAITGHSSEEMSEHYSHVSIAERKEAVTRALALVAPPNVGENVGAGTVEKPTSGTSEPRNRGKTRHSR